MQAQQAVQYGILAQWNSSRIWATDTNPWTGLNINSPTLYNYSYTNGTTLSASDAAYAKVTQAVCGTPAGKDPNQPATYRYIIYANVVNPQSSLYSYDWNISVPWLNKMGSQTVRTLTNGTVIYGTGQPNPDATNPVTVINAFAGDMLLCRNGSLPSIGTSFYATSWTPYTYFAVNLNASKGHNRLNSMDENLQPTSKQHYRSIRRSRPRNTCIP